MNASTHKHIGALDGLRGLAVLSVLAYHYGLSARMFGFSNPLLTASGIGWVGVDLFFVLSGFLITGILWDSRDSDSYLRTFFARRVLRILPLYYAASLLVTGLSVAWPAAGVWGTYSPLWTLFYLPNVAMALGGGEATGILGHYWSLAIEEHFYLVWPFVVFFASRRQLITIASLTLLGSLALRVALATSYEGWLGTYVLTPARLDGLAVGALCALAIRGSRGIAATVRPAWVAAVGGGAAVLTIIQVRGTMSQDDIVMQTIGYSCIAIAFGGLLLMSLRWRPLAWLLELSPLRWFGRYSYGIYVWHPIVNVLLFYTPIKAWFGVDEMSETAVYMLAALALSLLVALGSYHLLESPFLRLKARFDHPRKDQTRRRASSSRPAPQAVAV